jgi:hypothetical protein
MNLMRTVCLAGALALPGAAFAHDREAMNEDAYIKQPVHFDSTFERSAGDCTYKVRVSGSVTPVSNEGNGKIPAVDPKLDVMAEAKCPNVETAKLTSHILGVQPLTWRQLSDGITQRSHVMTVEQSHACTYGAQFRLLNANLELQRFDHYCKAI